MGGIKRQNRKTGKNLGQKNNEANQNCRHSRDKNCRRRHIFDLPRQRMIPGRDQIGKILYRGIQRFETQH